MKLKNEKHGEHKLSHFLVFSTESRDGFIVEPGHRCLFFGILSLILCRPQRLYSKAMRSTISTSVIFFVGNLSVALFICLHLELYFKRKLLFSQSSGHLLRLGTSLREDPRLTATSQIHYTWLSFRSGRAGSGGGDACSGRAAVHVTITTMTTIRAGRS